MAMEYIGAKCDMWSGPDCQDQLANRKTPVPEAIVDVAALGVGFGSMVLARAVFSRALVRDFEWPPTSGDTCESLTGPWAVSIEDFKKLNPGVACPDLVSRQIYCLMGAVMTPLPPPPRYPLAVRLRRPLPYSQLPPLPPTDNLILPPPPPPPPLFPAMV